MTCWDVRAGARIGASEQAYLAAYSSIDVVFDDRDMYVCNKTSVVNLSFDFGDPRCWIPVPLRLSDESSAVLRIYPACAQPPFADLRPRCWSLPVELETLEEVVEHRLSENVRAQREVVGFSTKFDDHLAQLLHVAVANCEWERLGVSDSMPFSQMIERACSPGEVDLCGILDPVIPTNMWRTARASRGGWHLTQRCFVHLRAFFDAFLALNFVNTDSQYLVHFEDMPELRRSRTEPKSVNYFL